MMIRTGILMPRSTLYPALGLDILNGIKQYLKQAGIFDEIKLLTDNIGFGTDEAEIYAKAEKMLLQEDVYLVILCADSRIAEMLQPLFTATNKLLLVVNFGANFPESWQPAPTTIIHSLNFCLHTYLTGTLAAKEINKQAANVISYYDGGYRQCYTMLQAHQANAGVPKFNHITHLKLQEFTLQPLQDFLEANTDVQTLLCLFAAEQAEKFYNEITLLQKKFNLTLYVSPMMLDVGLKASVAEAFSIQNVKGYAPWHPALKNKHNDLFTQVLNASGNTAVNYFSLLGWETGLILEQIYRQFAAGKNNVVEVVKQLTQIVFNSPRGWVKIDPLSHNTYGPAWLLSVNDNMEVRVEAELENIETAWADLKAVEMPPGESSSWRNTYLCI